VVRASIFDRRAGEFDADQQLGIHDCGQHSPFRRESEAGIRQEADHRSG
jgi:hypothetical protein